MESALIDEYGRGELLDFRRCLRLASAGNQLRGAPAPLLIRLSRGWQKSDCRSGKNRGSSALLVQRYLAAAITSSLDITTLLTDPATIRLEYFVSEPKSITLVINTIQAQPCRPQCDQPSISLHSNYQRPPADLPWHGVAIKRQLPPRKLRCQNPLCSQKIFCERIPQAEAVYARKTVRLNQALTLLAFALGGEAGGRVVWERL